MGYALDKDCCLEYAEALSFFTLKRSRCKRTEEEGMKRKTFVKQLMALGLERNKANSFCKQMLARRDRLRALGFHSAVHWENIFEFLVSGMQSSRNGRAV